MHSKDMPPRRDHDELSQGDVRALLRASLPYPEDHLFLLLLARTGRRIGEILGMTVRDIDSTEACIWTRIEKRRDRQRRKMFVDSDILSKLNGHVEAHVLSGNDLLFRRCMRVYQRVPMRYAAKAGIDKYFTCHSFRHYFITHLIKLGWSYDAIQRLTGHTSLASLHAYDHAQIEVVEDRFRAISW